jgi:acetoacetate decarboxylase
MTPESEFVYVFYDIDTVILERNVPDPLEVPPESDGPRVRLAVGDGVQPPHSQAPYHEGVVSVKVCYENYTGWYSVYIWTHNDEAMDAGRIYGINKQICENTPLRHEGNQIVGEMKRYGDDLYTVTFTYDSPPPQARAEDLSDKLIDYMDGGGIVGVKKIPSPDPEGKVLKQVIHAQLQSIDVEEIWEGNATVAFHPNAKYPDLHKFEPANQPEDIEAAFYVRPDFVLPGGNVVWERFE